MQAIVSGRARVAFLRRGEDAWGMVRYEGADVEVPCRTAEVNHRLSGCGDVRQIDDADEDAVRRTLYEAVNLTEAVDLSLWLLDDTLSDSIRYDAARELHGFLASSLFLNEWESVFFASPLPAVAAVKNAIRCARAAGASCVVSAIEDLENHREAIQAVHTAFQSAMASADEATKAGALRESLRSSVFPELARIWLEGGGPRLRIEDSRKMLESRIPDGILHSDWCEEWLRSLRITTSKSKTTKDSLPQRSDEKGTTQSTSVESESSSDSKSLLKDRKEKPEVSVESDGHAPNAPTLAQAKHASRCVFCATRISQRAIKCPQCLSFQNRFVNFALHPAWTIVLMGVCLLLTLHTQLQMRDVDARLRISVRKEIDEFRAKIARLEKFVEPSIQHVSAYQEAFRDQLLITEANIIFGKNVAGDTVAVLGKLKNTGDIPWNNVILQVDFHDSEGRVTDVGQRTLSNVWFVGKKTTSFKVSFERDFPETKYANVAIRIVDAQDARSGP
jgi:hypothetical protein